jgi:DNA-binding NarL/FixJ family response regulator
MRTTAAVESAPERTGTGLGGAAGSNPSRAGSNRALRLLVADDHEVMRAGLVELLESVPGWHVCADVGDGRTAVDAAAMLHPDVAILDVAMPGLDGLEAARRIRGLPVPAEVVFFSADGSDSLTRQGLATGARGFVLKADPAPALLAAVEAVSRSELFASPGLSWSPGTPGVEADRTPPELTAREREVVRLLAEGKSNWCVAVILGIAVSTVETHRRNVMSKLRLESVVELVHYAIRCGLVAP